MQKPYDMDYKIQTVQELINSLAKETKVTKENYLVAFGNIINSMIDELGFDKSKKGQKIVNEKFKTFMLDEFLPQYCKILGEDVEIYKEDAKKRFQNNLVY